MKNNIQIGIIAALQQELDILISHLEDKKTEYLYNRKIYKGRIGKVKVIILLGDIGKVNAAISSQILISNFKLNALIVTGLAGALNPKYEIGDVIIADKIFQHDYGFLGDEGIVTHKPGTLPELGIGSSKESFIDSLSILNKGNNNQIIEYTNSLRESFVKIKVDNCNRQPKVYLGTIATGDQFICSENRKEEIAKLGADIVEMEGAAIAKVAAIFDIPLIIIRAISDKACSKAEFDFSSFISKACENNAKIIINLINEYE